MLFLSSRNSIVKRYSDQSVGSRFMKRENVQHGSLQSWETVIRCFEVSLSWRLILATITEHHSTVNVWCFQEAGCIFLWSGFQKSAFSFRSYHWYFFGGFFEHFVRHPIHTPSSLLANLSQTPRTEGMIFHTQDKPAWCHVTIRPNGPTLSPLPVWLPSSLFLYPLRFCTLSKAYTAYPPLSPNTSARYPSHCIFAAI